MKELPLVQHPQPRARVTPIDGGRAPRVALVDCPWDDVRAPSIRLGTLAAELHNVGVDAEVIYLNADCAAAIGPGLYTEVSSHISDSRNLFGEWLFNRAALAEAAGGSEYLDGHRTVTDYLGYAEISDATINDLRDRVLPDWADSAVAGVDWSVFDLVGFSSVFAQQCATLAVSRRIRERHPNVPLVFGGANFDGWSGLEFQRVFPWLDYVVVGEGDIALPALVDALARGVREPDIPGVYGRRSGARALAGGGPGPHEAARVADMDTLPTPHYDDYYRTLDRVGRERVCGAATPRIVMETSRGCWWGEKHHCTFCGLKQSGMAYRSKSPERARREIVELSEKHRCLRIEMVDDIIDPRYAVDLAGRLAEDGHDFEIFYEMKANTKPADLVALRRAGVRYVQPGIESLSTRVLGLMNKGTDLLKNVRFLKWATALGMSVQWNILSGFPGEKEEDNQAQAALIPQLVHLAPPNSADRLWLERFSPLYEAAYRGEFPLVPMGAYREVYPIEGIDYGRIAYFFEYPSELGASLESFEPVKAAARKWMSSHTLSDTPPKLEISRGPGFVTLVDTRFGQGRRAQLEGWQAAAYQAAELTAVPPRKVRQVLSDRGFGRVTIRHVEEFFDNCCEQQIMITERGAYLALAIPRTLALPALPG